MTSTLAVSAVASRTTHPRRRLIARIAIAAIVAIGIFITPNRVAEAQTARDQEQGFEFLLTSGAVVPTGAQRDVLKSGNLSAAQLSYRVRPALVLTATLGWARSRDVASPGNPKLDVFTYDLGAEVRAPRWHGRTFNFRAFAGMGAGARSYDYRSLDADATHNLAAYGSVGGEVGIWRVRLRIEARDYVTGFEPLNGIGATGTRNDVVMLIGLRFVKP